MSSAEGCTRFVAELLVCSGMLLVTILGNSASNTRRSTDLVKPVEDCFGEEFGLFED